MRLRKLVILALVFGGFVLAVSRGAWAQVNTVNLFGTVVDPQSLAVKDARITVKNLPSFGTRDGIFPPEQGATYQQLMPNAFLSYVFDAAHDIQGDRPEAFAAVVSDFLDRHGEFLVYDGSTLIHQ